jgi:hypothetical protein
LADHPANITPYIPKDDKVKVYKTPIEKSEIANPCPKGITAHPNKLKTKDKIGAK